MNFSLITRLLTLFWAIIALAQPTWASDSGALQHSLWVDTLSIDLSNSQVVKSIVQQPIHRIIVPVLQSGQTLFDTKSKIFRQAPLYKDQEDALQALIVDAHLSGKEVYAYVDCLHWSDGAILAEKDVIKQQPELAERTLKGEFSQPVKDVYASPFHPVVRQVLLEFVEELSARYPKLDGLILQCRLPQEYWLGFSETARVAFLREAQVDPVDLFESQSGTQVPFYKWTIWRQGQVDLLVRELSTAFRKSIPHGKVAVVGYANTYRLSPALLSRTLEDWRNWVRQGLADEVILQPRPQFPGQDFYTHALDIVKKANQPNTQLTWLLQLRQGEKENNPHLLLEELAGQGVTGLAVRAEKESDIQRALTLWQDILPDLEPALRGKGKAVDLFQIEPKTIFFGLVSSSDGASKDFKISRRDSQPFEVSQIKVPPSITASVKPNNPDKSSWLIVLQIPVKSQPAVIQKDVIVTVTHSALPNSPSFSVELQVPLYAIIK